MSVRETGEGLEEAGRTAKPQCRSDPCNEQKKGKREGEKEGGRKREKRKRGGREGRRKDRVSRTPESSSVKNRLSVLHPPRPVEETG